MTISITITGEDSFALQTQAEMLSALLAKANNVRSLAVINEEAKAAEVTKTEEPKKRGRPAKTEDAPKEEPVENDKTVTADHPKRAELKTVAKEYASKTDTATAQKAIKLFGENTNVVPDAQLTEAINHIKLKLSKLGDNL